VDKQSLHTLLNLNVDTAFRGFIIYSKEASPRLNYVSEFIFRHVLKVNIVITNSISEFENSSLYKINYSTAVLPGAFQITPHSLLFETGISENKPQPFLKDELIYFYENKQQGNTTQLDYDIFSSVFYFISRYEEWQVFKPDVHGRFEAKESILYQYKMHLKPVVDIWIMELKHKLNGFFTGIKFPETKFKAISTIDVDNLYAYKAKGFLRTTGGIAKDVLKFDIQNLKHRLNVVLFGKKDPFDIYSTASEFCSKNQIPLIYFFLFRTGTLFDRTVDPSSNAFNEVFKRIKEHSAFIGLHPSYYTLDKKETIIPERKLLSQKINEKILLSRQHYLRFNIRTTPLMLMENGLEADFTMGFASTPGFRAGTSYPFYYYDFVTERGLQLLFVPFCAMDGAYFVYDKIDPDKMLSSLTDLLKEVKKVNGLFISVFHERTFSNHLYPGYDRIYNNLHQTLNAL